MADDRTVVTLATRVFEPEATAAAFRLGALVRTITASGSRALVLTTRVPGHADTRSDVHRWPVLRDRAGAVRGYVQYASFDIPLFFRLLFGRRSDVYVVEPPPTTGAVTRVAAWLRRTPYVYFAADVLSTAAAGIGVHPFIVSGVRALERFALTGAAGVLAVSEAVKHEVVALGADPARVTVVGTGIDTRAFPLTGPRAEPGYRYFIYAGTMSEIHGAGVFIDAFGEIAAEDPTMRLLMFGSGVELDELRERAEHLGERVQFPGLLAADELSEWIRGAVASLASVRPGRGYDFAFTTKALTSLSCGTPVVYAGVGPMADMIERDDLGWVADWDVSSVTRAMREALSDVTSDRSARLSNWVESNYSADAVARTSLGAVLAVASSRR